MNTSVHVLTCLLLFPFEPFESKLQSSWHSTHKYFRTQLLSLRTKCPFFYKIKMRVDGGLGKKNPYLAKIKRCQPSPTAFLEMGCSMNAKSGSHWWRQRLLLWSWCPVRGSSKPWASLPDTHAAQASSRGWWGGDVQLKKLMAPGLGYRLRGLLGHTHEENWYIPLNINYKMKILCPHHLGFPEAESTWKDWATLFSKSARESGLLKATFIPTWTSWSTGCYKLGWLTASEIITEILWVLKLGRHF